MNLFSYDQKRDTFTLDQYTLAGSVLRAELERARAVATTCRERCIAGGKTAEGLAEYYLVSSSHKAFTHTTLMPIPKVVRLYKFVLLG